MFAETSVRITQEDIILVGVVFSGKRGNRQAEPVASTAASCKGTSELIPSPFLYRKKENLEARCDRKQITPGGGGRSKNKMLELKFLASSSVCC